MTRKQAVFIILVNAMISALISVGVALLVILPDQGDQGDSQQVEVIPNQASDSAAQDPRVTETVAPVPPTATPVTYVVQPGDTLSSLALKFDVPGAAIIAANQIQNPDFLVAGVELSIPVGGLPPATATWTPMAVATDTPLPFEPPSANQTATAVSAASGTSPEATAKAGGLQIEITRIVGAGSVEQEQVLVTNIGDELADLEGWTLGDAEGNTTFFRTTGYGQKAV